MQLILANFEQADARQAMKRLTEGQVARLEGIRSEKARGQFMWSRVIYNGLIRRITGAMPTFELEPGRPHPSFKHQGTRYWTTLSHTGAWVAVALDTAPLAIDLETMKPRQWQALSEFTFSDQACRWIEESPSPLESFYVIWGQRECEIKMQSFEKTPRLFRATKITTQPTDLMLTCLCDPQSTWKPQILPITLLENF
jgi:phosphopantetheinyl transferase